MPFWPLFAHIHVASGRLGVSLAVYILLGMARELPIFPLPIILFPGAPQPLHIFEPRYRQLLADCLAADRRFGVAYVAPPRAPDDDPAPRPGDLGCVALIRSTQELPDGRSNVLTVGERRFVLIAWCAGDQPYRLGRVEEFDDEPSEPGEAEALAAGVRDDFSRLVGALGVLTDREHEAIELPADPQELSFQVSAALELDAEAKRSLQALRSTTARLRHLGGLLDPLATDAERRAAVRPRPPGDRRGRPPPPIPHTPRTRPPPPPRARPRAPSAGRTSARERPRRPPAAARPA